MKFICMVAYTYNPNIQEAEWFQPSLHIKFKTSQGCKLSLCLKTKLKNFPVLKMIISSWVLKRIPEDGE